MAYYRSRKRRYGAGASGGAPSAKRRRYSRLRRRNVLGTKQMSYRRRRGYGGRRRHRSGRSANTSGLHAKITSSDGTLDIPAAGEVSGSVNFKWSDIFADTVAATEITPYGGVFDRVMVKKMTLEIWLNDNDEVTKADNVFTRLYRAYDPDSKAALFTSDQIRKIPSHKFSIMKPGVVYRMSVSPKWEVNVSGTGTDVPRMGNYSGWFDYTALSGTSTSPAANTMVWSVTGPQEAAALRFRRVWELAFNHRRQNSTPT